MGWTQKREQRIAEMLVLSVSSGIKYKIDRMLYKLDSENNMKSSIGRLADNDTIRLSLTNNKSELSTEGYLSIRKMMATKSRWETLQLIKQKYFHLKESLENFEKSIINSKPSEDNYILHNSSTHPWQLLTRSLASYLIIQAQVVMIYSAQTVGTRSIANGCVLVIHMRRGTSAISTGSGDGEKIYYWP